MPSSCPMSSMRKRSCKRSSKLCVAFATSTCKRKRIRKLKRNRNRGRLCTCAHHTERNALKSCFSHLWARGSLSQSSQARPILC